MADHSAQGPPVSAETIRVEISSLCGLISSVGSRDQMQALSTFVTIVTKLSPRLAIHAAAAQQNLRVHFWRLLSACCKAQCLTAENAYLQCPLGLSGISYKSKNLYSQRESNLTRAEMHRTSLDASPHKP